MLIDIICAPPSAPQVLEPNLASSPSQATPQLDWLDNRILHHLQATGSIPIWSLLNRVANELSPDNREAGRVLRLHLLVRLKRLRRLGRVFFVGRNRIAPTKPPPSRTLMRTRQRRRTVIGSRSVSDVSAANPRKTAKVLYTVHVQKNQTLKQGLKQLLARPLAEKTESAADPAQIAGAARWLAKRRNKNQPPKKWTGWLRRQHCWRERLVVLPDGEIAPLMWASRGHVLLRNYRDMEFSDYLLWASRREHEVRLYKSPEAVLLGSLKKGVIERFSKRKVEIARVNGCKPCRTGKKRGRPAKSNY